MADEAPAGGPAKAAGNPWPALLLAMATFVLVVTRR